MLVAYDNLVWFDLEFHSDGRSVEFSDSFVTLGMISLGFTFLAFVVATIGSLAFTNFTSLEILAAELLSLVYRNPVLLEKDF